MIVEFEKDYLQELYDKGSCKNKKYRFQKQVIAKYQKRVDILIATYLLVELIFYIFIM